ncbi:MAG: hypothetical protein AMQ22_00608 [Candidatus Methanofastidiosum methylothiophilum]|uniref:Uncharacterized protein n=1 Tax=Candidatus Methanofastidiosum methylothiophilum TaxID=1705564 RepID=A0A150J6F9_9EURY|nr:MAG: hypothetical protein AMQ22_00608 [Candidatus Methanofastidiosum methylthiophilus]
MKENIDYGFIDICQIDHSGGRHTSTLMWHKGSNLVDVLGNIPHGNKIEITEDIIVKFADILEKNLDMW